MSKLSRVIQKPSYIAASFIVKTLITTPHSSYRKLKAVVMEDESVESSLSVDVLGSDNSFVASFMSLMRVAFYEPTSKCKTTKTEVIKRGKFVALKILKHEDLRSVLSGQRGPIAYALVLNAATALTVSGRVGTLAEAVTLAQDTLQSGKVIKTLDRWIVVS
ncbi:hypothetical protein M8C21_029003, partial [Ambrosia artemisiifolia]